LPQVLARYGLVEEDHPQTRTGELAIELLA
jgi:hypothetical protein